jgi:two-component system response regulator YesN
MSIVYKIISDMKKQSVLRLHPKNYLKIEDAVAFLKKHFCDEDFRISTLYKIADTSPKYFNTLFKTQFGMPPKEYALFLKTEKAKELLLDKKLSIGYIAEVLGFVDLYHFSKFFKKETSYSPTEYRKIMQK